MNQNKKNNQQWKVKEQINSLATYNNFLKELSQSSSRGFPGGSVVENPPASTGDACSIPGSERSPADENGNPLKYSCLGESMDRGVWQAIVHGVTKSLIWLSDSAHTQNGGKGMARARTWRLLVGTSTGAPSESQLAICIRSLSDVHAFDPIISSLGISPKETYRMWTKLYVLTCALVCYSQYWHNKKYKHTQAED